VSDKKRYGDPRKRAQESAKPLPRRSKRELSVGFIAVTWLVFFIVWLVAGLLVAAIVFGALLVGGTAVLSIT
jgi:Flp pilus assembly protein TadB